MSVRMGGEGLWMLVPSSLGRRHCDVNELEA